MSKKWADMAPEQSFFAVFCIENVADALEITGDVVYKMLAEESDILDRYIIPNYEALHTQSKDWIVEDIIGVMKQEGILK